MKGMNSCPFQHRFCYRFDQKVECFLRSYHKNHLEIFVGMSISHFCVFYNISPTTTHILNFINLTKLVLLVITVACALLFYQFLRAVASYYLN